MDFCFYCTLQKASFKGIDFAFSKHDKPKQKKNQ